MKIFRFFALAGILLLASGIARATAVNVYFSPSNTNVAVGSNFQIDIMADTSGNPNDFGIVDWAFDLVYDESLMQLTDVSGTGSPWDIFLWDDKSITAFLNPTLSSPASESGTGLLLAVLDFKCLGVGTSTLDIDFDEDLVKQQLQGLYDSNGALVDVTSEEANITQVKGPVPEPSMLLFLSSGLTALAFWKKRK